MAAPVNDNFSDRILLSGATVSTSGTNVDATKEVGEPDLVLGGTEFHSVWYEWVAPASGRLLLDTTGSAFNTKIGIFTGDVLASLTLIGADTIGFDGTDAALFVNVTEGVSYKIMVDGHNFADSGTFVLNLTLVNVCGVTCGTSPAGFQVGKIIDTLGGSEELMFPTGVVVDGNYAYIAVGGGGGPAPDPEKGVEIVDVSDPSNPVHNSKYTVPLGDLSFGRPNEIAKKGNYIYVTIVGDETRELGLLVVDVSDVNNPTLEGFLGYGTSAAGEALTGIWVEGNYAYVGSTDGTDSVKIIDISTPATPTQVGELAHGSGGALLSSPGGLVKNGNYLYVCASGSDAIEVVDVSTPSAPTHAGSIVDGAGGATIDNPKNIVLHNSNYLILTSFDDNAIEVLDITTPTSPVHYSRFDHVAALASELSEPIDLEVSGNYLFVTRSKLATGNGMSVLNISTLSAITYCKYLGGHDAINGPYLVLPYGIYVSGNYVYVTNRNSTIAGGMTIFSALDTEDCIISDEFDLSTCNFSVDNLVQEMPVDTIFTGLSHLEGETVAILADGNVLAQRVVSNGRVTITGDYTVVHIGLPYYSDLETLNISLGEDIDTLQGRKIKVGNVDMMFVDSRGGYIGDSESNIYEAFTDLMVTYNQSELEFNQDIETLSSATALYTGHLRVPLGSKYKYGGRVFYRQVDPLPVLIGQIIPEVSVGGAV